jgi:hypothetical protein
VIPTPASRLTRAPLRRVRRPDARPLDLERRYHTKCIAAIEWAAEGRRLSFETTTGGRVSIWRVPADRAAA